MKFGLVTNLEKGNKTASKKLGDDLMSANCDAVVIFQIHYQFVAILKPDSGWIVYKTFIFINSNLLSYKN